MKKPSSVSIWRTSWRRGALERARTGLLLPHQLYRLLHLRNPLHHLDLKLLILVDACNQLLSLLLNPLSILDSLPLHLHQSSLAGRMDVSRRRA